MEDDPYCSNLRERQIKSYMGTLMSRHLPERAGGARDFVFYLKLLVLFKQDSQCWPFICA